MGDTKHRARATFASGALVLALGFVMVDARAADGGSGPNPCGNFDFTAGISCKIQVSGGCSANCSPLRFEAACTGMCGATADTMCVDNCGTTCVAMCNPALLDCFKGCHDECDGPTVEICKKDHPNEDCATNARAQCDVHCNDSCKVPPNSCQEHCNKCCTGSCTTQINFACDFSCFADVKGGCDVQCQKPEGAIFCNDQYVHASDVKACITYLATQGIKVDASATGTVGCDLSGCHESGSSKGCSVSPSSAAGGASGVAALLGLAAALVRSRSRKRRTG
jgi:MYXO-CTERM domain-containing protein